MTEKLALEQLCKGPGAGVPTGAQDEPWESQALLCTTDSFSQGTFIVHLPYARHQLGH